MFFYNLKTIGLRFFTVYGPWGRPDMSLLNLRKIFNNKHIELTMVIITEILLI